MASRESRGALARRILARPLDAIGVVGLLVYALPSFWYPFSSDQPIHWYIGRDLLHGHLPYTTAISTKGPLTFLVHAIGMAFLGEGTETLRVLDFVFVLLAVVVAVSFRPRVRGPDGVRHQQPIHDGEIGATALVAGAIHYTFFDFSDTGHPEPWLGVAMLAAAAVVVRAPDFEVSARRAFAAGVVACLAVTFKHVGAFTGVVVGAAIVWLGLRQSFRVAARNAAVYTLGVASVLGLLSLVYVVAGEFDVLWDVMVRHILAYAGEGIPPPSWPSPWLRLNYGLFALFAGVAGLLVGGAVARNGGHRALRFTAAFLGLMVVGAVATVLGQRRAFIVSWSYYWLMVVPFLVAAVSWGLRMWFLRRPRGQLLAAAGLLAAAMLYEPSGTHVEDWSYLQEWTSWHGYMTGTRTYREHHQPHRKNLLDHHNNLLDVARYIRSRTRPGDTLCVDEWILHLFVMTELRCPSRFLSTGFYNREESAWAEEHAAMMRDTPPQFFVTFGDRRGRVRELVRAGYVEHTMRFDDGAWFAVMERPRPEEVERAEQEVEEAAAAAPAPASPTPRRVLPTPAAPALAPRTNIGEAAAETP